MLEINGGGMILSKNFIIVDDLPVISVIDQMECSATEDIDCSVVFFC